MAVDDEATDEVAGTIACALDGSLGINLGAVGWEFYHYDGLSEVWLRNKAGDIFSFTIVKRGADEPWPGE